MLQVTKKNKQTNRKWYVSSTKLAQRANHLHHKETTKVVRYNPSNDCTELFAMMNITKMRSSAISPGLMLEAAPKQEIERDDLLGRMGGLVKLSHIREESKACIAWSRRMSSDKRRAKATAAIICHLLSFCVLRLHRLVVDIVPVDLMFNPVVLMLH
eukprot:3209701-Amphidinium_carterae.1